MPDDRPLQPDQPDTPAPSREPSSEPIHAPAIHTQTITTTPIHTSTISAPPEPAAPSPPDLQPFQLQSPEPPPPAPQPRRLPFRPKPEEASQSPFTITVAEVYDGPMDLLLDLIRKQNIDIYDIPIARLTAQFLEYTRHLQATDVDAAGEFIYMASLLIHIKSRLLLPRDPSDVTGTDSEDPRRELVERLLEHERFKAAAQMLLQKQQVENATWTYPGMPGFLRDAAGPDQDLALADPDREIAADTIDLVRVFSDILARLRARPVLNVDEDQVTVRDMMDFLKRRLLLEDRPVSLRRLLNSTHTERAVICAFLAMLELVRLQAVMLHQPQAHGDILIKKSAGFDRLFEAGDTPHDDWR